MLQNRIKSKVVWIAIATQIISLLIALDIIDTGIGDTIKTIIISICELLVTFGILNNPTSQDTF